MIKPDCPRTFRRIVGVAALAFSAPLYAQSSPNIRPLQYTRFVLKNGLTAILNEDHAAPIVAVDLWYRIGSRDDKPGRIGIAHFCEHVMGEGSPGVDGRIPDLIRAAGGTSPNMAATSEDITHYFYTVPSNELETMLWMEGDRMAHPFSKADSQHVDAIRGVVTQERLQQFVNGPVDNRVRDIVGINLFGDGPYRASYSSPLQDLPHTSSDDVKEACGPYYVPNNAVLALSGDFTQATARAWIDKYFGGIPRAATPKRDSVRSDYRSPSRRLVLEDSKITAPRLYFDWAGGAYANPDRLSLLAVASTLSLSRFSLDAHYRATGVSPPPVGRLAKLLVQDRQLATQVVADNIDNQRVGVFEILVTPRPGASLAVIETLVDSVMTDLSRTPVTPAELGLFNRYLEVQLALSLQKHAMRADTLAHDEVFAGDPSAYATQLRASQKLTPADVDRVVKKYFSGGHLLLTVVPQGKLDLLGKPEMPYTNVSPSATKATP